MNGSNIISMKKGLIVLLCLLLALTVFTYLWIPATIQLRPVASIKYARTGLERTLYDNSTWRQWWPGQQEKQKPDSLAAILVYKDYHYRVGNKTSSSISIDMDGKDISLNSTLRLFFVNKDSALIEWNAAMPTSNNPIKRISRYREAQKIKKQMEEVLSAMQSFFSKTENIYGVLIQEVLVEDSLLTFMDKTVKGYPSITFIYDMIHVLEKNIEENNAKATGYPMLNIQTDDSLLYTMKVAIPVDRQLKPLPGISYRLMVKRGNILVTEVKGGPWVIKNTFIQLEHYLADHEKIAMAIPYQSLVTNRLEQPDTSKWVTRIYYPVM